MRTTILALSGFLGLPSDWGFLSSHGVVGIDWQVFDWNSLPDWSAKFNQSVPSLSQAPPLLIGYSFGGRLALHSLVNQPALWKGAVIISAHPGLTNSFEKQKRLKHDRQWAKRFANEEWSSLIKAWNCQEIFATEHHVFERREENYQRDRLSRALIQGSLGSQGDLRQPISQLQVPILWLTGSRDPRYCALAQGVSFQHPLSRRATLAGAGHRLPWSHPDKFTELCFNFFEEIDSCNYQ